MAAWSWRRKRACAPVAETPTVKRTRGATSQSVTAQIYVALRKVQRTTGCTTSMLQKILKALSPFLNVAENLNVEEANKEIFERSGATMMKLNGCVGCHEHVFLPSETLERCPKCEHPRYSNGRANEASV